MKNFVTLNAMAQSIGTSRDLFSKFLVIAGHPEATKARAPNPKNGWKQIVCYDVNEAALWMRKHCQYFDAAAEQQLRALAIDPQVGV
ncbi:hypothetical protein [Sulfitobacter geojensis]|uniref:hypothetical protein n=1 Tax=Sulfitobacter geojensis TaxID=1342299 RepID=UPI0007D9B3BF|nr:hypothetical protein [Sulfitobacter geojensis]OAN98072.1 hypothetical protein A8B74_01685 [Sulfitobacter geojensis]